MKIAIDCRFWGPKNTGLGRYTQGLVENLLEIDKKNHYYLLFRKSNHDVKLATINKNIDIIFTNVEHYSFKEQLLIPILLKKINPDLVHFPHFNIPFLWSKKYIVTIHDLIKHQSKGKQTTTRKPWVYFFKYLGYKFIFFRVVKKAEKVIVPSTWTKKLLLKAYKFKQDKIKVIYEGVNKAFISNKEKESQEILTKHKIKKPYIIYTGNAYPHKNLRRLILAVKLINNLLRLKKQKQLNLVIVCARDVFWQRLKKEILQFNASSFVILPGFVKDGDLSFIYSQAEAFVSPSLMEGFGLPGIEAMSSKCPVICSNISVFKEIYKNAAIYFNPEDLESIRDKILDVLNFSSQQRQEIIKKGIVQAQQYSWENCALNTLKVYESCFSL